MGQNGSATISKPKVKRQHQLARPVPLQSSLTPESMVPSNRKVDPRHSAPAFQQLRIINASRQTPHQLYEILYAVYYTCSRDRSCCRTGRIITGTGRHAPFRQVHTILPSSTLQPPAHDHQISYRILRLSFRACRAGCISGRKFKLAKVKLSRRLRQVLALW